MTRWQANLVLLVTGAIWGAAFIAQSTAMEALGPFSFIAARFAVACAVVAPILWWEARRAATPLTRRDHGVHVGIGLALFLGMAFQQVGLLTTTVTNSGILTGLYVLFVPVLGIALFRQWPHPVVWLGAAGATLGIFLIGGGGFDRLVVGDAHTVVSAAFWSVQVVLIARFVRRAERPVALAFTQFAVTAALAALCAAAFEDVTATQLRAAAFEILYAGVLGSGVAFTLQVIGQRYTTAPQAAIFLSSEALFAALFGALLLGERLPAVGLVGCALVFASMLAVEIVPMLRRRPVETVM